MDLPLMARIASAAATVKAAEEERPLARGTLPSITIFRPWRPSSVPQKSINPCVALLM